MPLIKPRTRGKQLVKHRTRLDRENNETLYAYAHFLGESTEYVLNQVIDTVLAKDKELLLSAFIRVPVTEDQKARIDDAARRAESDTAKWARSVLLREAVRALGKASVRKVERG